MIIYKVFLTDHYGGGVTEDSNEKHFQYLKNAADYKEELTNKHGENADRWVTIEEIKTED